MLFFRILISSIFLFSSSVWAFEKENHFLSYSLSSHLKLTSLSSEVLDKTLKYVEPEDLLRLDKSGDKQLQNRMNSLRKDILQTDFSQDELSLLSTREFLWKRLYFSRKNKEAGDFSSNVNSWKNLYKFVSSLRYSVALLDWGKAKFF